MDLYAVFFRLRGYMGKMFKVKLPLGHTTRQFKISFYMLMLIGILSGNR